MSFDFFHSTTTSQNQTMPRTHFMHMHSALKLTLLSINRDLSYATAMALSCLFIYFTSHIFKANKAHDPMYGAVTGHSITRTHQ